MSRVYRQSGWLHKPNKKPTHAPIHGPGVPSAGGVYGLLVVIRVLCGGQKPPGLDDSCLVIGSSLHRIYLQPEPFHVRVLSAQMHTTRFNLAAEEAAVVYWRPTWPARRSLGSLRGRPQGSYSLSHL